MSAKLLFIKTIKIENLRNLSTVEIEPHPRLNVFYGDNGAGKTSILESLVVLSRGRSFRTSQAGELIGPNGKTFSIFAQTEYASDKTNRLGLERSGSHWRARKNGVELDQLSQLTRSLPLVLMEPNSHLVVSGTPEVRRKYLDWGMFHVERDYLSVWRKYSKILKQRNAALRFRNENVLDSIDDVMIGLGEALGAMRKSHVDQVEEKIRPLLEELSPQLADLQVDYHQGWSTGSLGDALISGRERDLQQGATHSGPHRADMTLLFRDVTAKSILSRGEQKILSAALLLSQAEVLSETGEKPVLLLDDLSSEFDQAHFDRVLTRSLAQSDQVWITGTRFVELDIESRTFHVKHGVVQEMI